MSGGTGVTVSLQGNPVPYNGGPYYIPAGGGITLNYSAAPTWAWAPCAQTQF